MNVSVRHGVFDRAIRGDSLVEIERGRVGNITPLLLLNTDAGCVHKPSNRSGAALSTRSTRYTV